MKLVFVALTLCRGGAQRMLVELSNGMVERGHQVTLLMPSTGVVEFSDVKARIQRVGRSALQAEDYPQADFLISNFYTSVATTQTAEEQGRGTHVRLALCYEPTFLPESHLSFPTYHMTDKLLVLSQWQQQIAYLNHGVRAKIVPVGVSSAFRNLHLRRADQPLTIAAVMRQPEGGYSWHRDQEYLLQQLDQAQARHPEIRILLIAPPSEYVASDILRKIVGERANRPGGASRFQLATPQNDRELNQLYNSADIYVTASLYDAGSLPSLEAMRCGAAVVTNYAGGNADYCRHDVNCLLAHRVEGTLGEYLNRLIENPPIRRRLAEAGERESNRWTWQRSVDALERALQEYSYDHSVQGTAKPSSPKVNTFDRAWAFRRSGRLLKRLHGVAQTASISVSSVCNKMLGL